MPPGRVRRSFLRRVARPAAAIGRLASGSGGVAGSAWWAAAWRRRRRVSIVVAAVAILGAGATATAAPAATVIVSPTAPTGSCTTTGLQCRTIARAVAVAPAGSTLSIGTGTYAEGGIAVPTKNLSFVASGPDVVLTGNGQAGSTTLALTATAPISVSGLTFRSRSAQSVPELTTVGPVTVQDVRFDAPAAATAGPQAQLTGSSDGSPTLRDTTFAVRGTGSSNALKVSGTPSAHARVTGVAVSREGPSGGGTPATGAAVDVADADVTGLHLSGNGGRLLVPQGVVSLADSTITADPGAVDSAIAVLYPLPGAASPHVTIRNTVVTGALVSLDVYDGSVDSAGSVYRDARTVDVFLWPGGTATVLQTHDLVLPPAPGALASVAILSGSATFRETVAGVVDRSGEGTCSSTASVSSAVSAGVCGLTPQPADLGFVDEADGNVHLKADSPLIDAGIANDPSTVELDGGPRTLDGNADGVAISDIGPDEYVPVPETTIASGPGATRPGEAATFGFSSTTAGVTFACTLDGGAPSACNGGTFTSAGLAAGAHTFQVAATVAGSTDPTPATRTFTLTAAPPVVTSASPVTAPPTIVAPPSVVAPSTTWAPPATGKPGAKKPGRLRLTALKLSHRRARGRHLSKAVTIKVRVSKPATVAVTLRRRTSGRATRKVGRTVRVRVKRAGTIKVRLNRLATSPKRGRYVVRVAGGSTSAVSKTLTLR